MQPTILSDADAVARAAADLVLATCRAHPPVGILLSGGTTPRAAYVLLATAAPGDLDSVHLWFGDERVVHPDHPDSNYGMVARAWLTPAAAPPPPTRVHRIRGELGAIEAARRASAELRAHAGDAPRFDLVLIGIGADGHTASLFPGDPALGATGLYVPSRGGTRVTATLPVLSAARHVVFLATGTAKAAICARVLRAPPSPDLPASLVHAERTTWLLDRDAAAQLT